MIIINKIKEWLKQHKISSIILILFTLFFIVPLLIHWTVSTKTPWGFITEDKQDAWINFYGAIIGGSITLGGVAWTIREQRKQSRIDKAMELYPILKIEFEQLSSENGEQLKLSLTLENIGPSPARDIVIRNCMDKSIIHEIAILPSAQKTEFSIKFDFPRKLSELIQIDIETNFTDIIQCFNYTLITNNIVSFNQNRIAHEYIGNNYKHYMKI